MPEIKTTIQLNSPIKELRGVGEERAAQLNRLGVQSILDLLLLKPRRYEDRREITPIDSLNVGESFLVKGKVVVKGVKYYKWRTKSVFEMVVEDESGRLHCRWWNQPYRDQMYTVGDELWIYGKVVSDRPKTMDNPETEIAEENDEDSSIHIRRIVPIYPLTEGLTQRWLRSLIWKTLNQFESKIEEQHPSL
ncbi:MAG: ATP-dependent DNA helicase RecG, partial [Verrucomicrobiia bacterium]